EGDVVHVDDVLGELDETAVAATAGATQSAAPAAKAAATTPVSTPTAARSAVPAPAAPAASTAQAGGTATKSSPAARRVADERGIDIAAVAGTGRGGAVSKPDVLAQPTGGERAAPPPPSRPSAPIVRPSGGGNGATPGERETREKMSTRRKRIAENLLQSQHATAHLTTFNEVDMSAVNALREKYKERVEKEHGVKLTFMPFFVRATVAALKQFPMVNAQIDGDSIIYKHYVNMGMPFPFNKDLVAQNIKTADERGRMDLTEKTSKLASRRGAGRLTLKDLTGGRSRRPKGGGF